LLDVVEYLIKILLSGVTVFSIYQALKNYISTTNAAIVNIHLTNLNTFKDYLQSEAHDNKAINIKKIDFLKWYNLLYPDSRNGQLNLSEKYQLKIDEINRIIENSNDYSLGKKANNALFDHNKHQRVLINALKTVGITLGFAPRNNFKEGEEAIFGLINKVNKEFCGPNGAPLIKPRKYH
jgi:hypothetical protein